MAENILEFVSKGFSKVLFSGSGISVDACLDRSDGIRVHDEQLQALFLLLEQTGSVLFCFDVEEDCLYYIEVLSDGTRLERKIADFVKALHAARDSVEPEGKVFAQALLEARGKKTSGTVKYRGKVFTQTVCWNKTSYRSLANERGDVYAIVGYNDVLEESFGESRAEASKSGDRIYEGKDLEQMVSARLRSLQIGEKGVLFLLSINNFDDSGTSGRMAGFYLRAVAEAIRSDFRGEDIIGRIREDVFLVFICGETSIDIIERRAQRILDLCQRVPMAEGRPTICSLGVAASGSGRQQFSVMLRQAETALAAAKDRGDNQYRLFEEEKY